MAVSVGFEPTLRYKRKHAFQACALSHSATTPYYYLALEVRGPQMPGRLSVHVNRGRGRDLVWNWRQSIVLGLKDQACLAKMVIIVMMGFVHFN